MKPALIQSKAILVRTLGFTALWKEEGELIPFVVDIYRSIEQPIHFRINCRVADERPAGNYAEFRARDFVTQADETSGVVDSDSAEQYAFLAIQDWLDNHFWTS